jgi:RNA polymerase sigma factor (sigma-70 family)
MNRHQAECSRLVADCARDTGNDIMWREFLIRYSSRIKQFIKRACSLWSAAAGLSSGALPRAIQQSDLFQSVIVRLVKNECAVMKAFSGTSEDEWLAYLAAITSSVVCDMLRCQYRLKRLERATTLSWLFAECWQGAHLQKRNQHLETERIILAGEVRTLCERIIGNLSGKHSARDLLIFRLYFLHDLSISQISTCRAVDLSASGVRKVLHGLRSRVRNVITGNVPQTIRRHGSQPCRLPMASDPPSGIWLHRNPK